jgi:hypothetical protein
MRFDPELHTADRLAEQMAQLDAMHPDMVVAGSLGRSVIYGKVGTPDFEFQMRQETPVHQHYGARDIDVIGVPEGALSTPFKLDTIAFQSDLTRISKQAGQWVLSSVVNEFAEPLNDAIMQPVTGPGVYGVVYKTVHPRTHVALFEAHARPRTKDILTRRLIRGTVDDFPHLPDSMFEPFTRLRQVKEASRLYKAQEIYRRIPEAWRYPVHPIAASLKQKYVDLKLARH